MSCNDDIRPLLADYAKYVHKKHQYTKDAQDGLFATLASSINVMRYAQQNYHVMHNKNTAVTQTSALSALSVHAVASLP